tara:strand:- start:343 stop:711 length:369 start_codon:yes stop_codon:yes gene_type:complete
MEYIFYIIITTFILIPIISAREDLKNNDIELNKAFNSASIKLIFALLLSVFLSVAIALNANIPASSGHGGFIYILGPFIFGIIILILYIAFLIICPKRKFILGIISTIVNICTGFYFMFSDF